MPDAAIHNGGDATVSGIEMRSLSSLDERDEEVASEVQKSDRETNLTKSTLRKLDFILLPFLSLLFCLNHLDKTNIGNAETAGFSHDAGLDQGDINIAMAYFFAFFVALQPLGAALGRKIGMARWVPACMSLWGLCTIMHIWVHSRWQLVLLRVVIATLEAGFYPTTVSYLSLFYTRYEFAVRLGVFYGQAAVSGALGGILSWAVFSRYAHDQDPDALLKPWQILFLVEGCITLVVALVGFIWLPHSANEAWFLNRAERSWSEKRILLDHDAATKQDATHTIHSLTNEHDGADERLLGEESCTTTKADHHDESLTADAGLQRQEILSAFLQYNIWHLLVCNILSAIPATAFGIFLPIIIKQMSPSLDISPAASNLLAVPPFAFGAIVLLAFTYWSDRSKQRLMPILAGLIILILGLSITVLTPAEDLNVRYVGLCILLGGSYIASPLTVAWLSNNTPQPGKRAMLLGINGYGNLAGVSSAVLFKPDDAAGGYATSFRITLICAIISFVGYSVFMLLIKRENQHREARTSMWSESERRRETQIGDVEMRISNKQKILLLMGAGTARRGDERLTYRYTF